MARPKLDIDQPLQTAAALLLAERALEKLDQAASLQELATAVRKATGMDSLADRTVKRRLAQASPDAQRLSSLVLAAQHLYDLDASGVGPNTTNLVVLFDRLLDTGNTPETVMRLLLLGNLRNPSTIDAFPAGFLLQCAAIAQERSPHEAEPAQARIAEQILELRRAFYDDMTETFAAGLGVALRRLRRRPRAGFTVREIIVLLHAVHDGVLHRMLLQPDAIDDTRAVDAMWEMAWGLTEPGLFAGDLDGEPTEVEIAASRLIDAAVELWRHAPVGHIVSLDAAAERADLDRVLALSIMPTDALLSERCLDRLAATITGLQQLAEGTAASTAALREALRQLGEVADEFPALLAAVAEDAPVRTELRMFVEAALVEATGVTTATATLQADELVRAALRGRVSGSRATELILLGVPL